MNWGKLNHFSLLVVAGFLAVSIQLAQAGAERPLSGTYQVVRKSQAGDLVQVRVQLHLVNPRTSDLHVQSIALWDFSHPAKGGKQPCSVVLHAAGFADITEGFTISRAEYELWKRGARPRLMLEFAGPDGHPRAEAIHLELLSGGKGN